MSKKSLIDWDKVKDFTPQEFSEDPDEFADPQIIYKLQEIRTQHNQRIFPSPKSGALARSFGSATSTHFAVGKKSIAVDFFPEGRAVDCLITCISIGGINGIGIYLDKKGVDGKPWIMFHIDVRPNPFHNKKPLIWFGIDNIHYFPHSESSVWEFMRDPRLYIDRRRQ